MSERMIELQRAKLLAATGSKGGAGQPGAQQNGSQHIMLPGQVAASTQQYQQYTPRQAAAVAMESEDGQMKRFLQRLQHERDDSRPGDPSLGPTVPTALSRRMLQRQGVGYLDSAVAAVTSAAADRFLATVLQQAVACRDQRLKGAEMARQAARKRRRHKRQYQEDTDDRIRRKEKHEAKRKECNLAAIAAAEALKQKSSASSSKLKDGEKAPASGSKSKKKKKADGAANGNKLKGPLSDEEASYDSIDEEEELYRDHYNDDDDEVSDSEDEEDDEMMILRDLARPLAAWDFHLEGKLGMDRTLTAEDDGDDDADQDADSAAEHNSGVNLKSGEQPQPMDIENSADDETNAAKNSSSRKSKSPEQDKKNSTLRKSSTSPVPPSIKPPAT